MKWLSSLKSALVGLAVEVYHWLLVKINRQKLELRQKDLEKETQENAHKFDRDTRSSRDVIRDAIERGRNKPQ